MYLTKIIAQVRNLLKINNFPYNGELTVVKIGKDIDILRLDTVDERYIIEYSQKDNLESRFYNKGILEKYGIKTGIVDCAKHLILYKDYNFMDEYRCASGDDLKNVDFVKSLARWYKKLHSVKGCKVKNYNDYFTLGSIGVVRKRFNLKREPVLLYLENNIDNLRLKLNRIGKCLSIMSFSLKNIVVSKENGELFMVNIDNLGETFSSVDISYVLDNLDEKMKCVFLEEYGECDKKEYVYYEVIWTVITLYLAAKNKYYNEETRLSLGRICKESTFNEARALVRWF